MILLFFVSNKFIKIKNWNKLVSFEPVLILNLILKICTFSLIIYFILALFYVCLREDIIAVGNYQCQYKNVIDWKSILFGLKQITHNEKNLIVFIYQRNSCAFGKLLFL